MRSITSRATIYIKLLLQFTSLDKRFALRPAELAKPESRPIPPSTSSSNSILRYSVVPVNPTAQYLRIILAATTRNGSNKDQQKTCKPASRRLLCLAPLSPYYLWIRIMSSASTAEQFSHVGVARGVLAGKLSLLFSFSF